MKMFLRPIQTITFTCLALGFLFCNTLRAQEPAKEDIYTKIAKIPTPDGLVLEIGGMTMLPGGELAVATRRGDVFVIENPSSTTPYFRKFATGLHEILGLAYKDGAIYCAQRGELTKLVDKDMDGKADIYETVYSWPLSGYYHEYSYGPKIANDGSFYVTANVAFGETEGWRSESRVPWRGWVMHIFPDGSMEPYATGMRSPCGMGMLDNELFYTDNQGDWVPAGGIVHVKKGSFTGNPAGLRWTFMPNSPLKLTQEQHNARFDERRHKDAQGRYVQPEDKDDTAYSTPADARKAFPEMQTPAVYLPHGILGISTSDLTRIPEGTFGPFAGQVLVGDQGQSKINRVFMEKVKGEYQGIAWEFRSGFQSGVLRMAWANDGSLFVGETNRGWGSAGDANQGIQRLVWNNNAPFEMLAVRAMPDGFEIEFTQPVDRKRAEDLASYKIESFTYKYHSVYGSPVVNSEKCPVKGVKVSADGLKARIIVDNLRKVYIHTITLDSIRSAEGGRSLVHPTGYYTLNDIPDGEHLKLSEVSTKNSALDVKPVDVKKKTAAEAVAAKSKTAAKFPTEAEIKPLLAKYTCNACHNADKRQVGPAFRDVAKRKYSIEKIMQLIYTPQPQNWPGYATQMPPMAQVPKEDAKKIAAWINALN
jgi:cytochrome c551/c552